MVTEELSKGAVSPGQCSAGRKGDLEEDAADGGAEQLGAAAKDGANKEEGTRDTGIVAKAVLQDTVRGESTVVPRDVEDTTADGGAEQLGAAAKDGANKEEGTRGTNTVAKAVLKDTVRGESTVVPRGVEDTTADGGAGQLGAAAKDGANKGEGTKSSLSESPCEPPFIPQGCIGPWCRVECQDDSRR